MDEPVHVPDAGYGLSGLPSEGPASAYPASAYPACQPSARRTRACPVSSASACAFAFGVLGLFNLLGLFACSACESSTRTTSADHVDELRVLPITKPCTAGSVSPHSNRTEPH